MPSIRLGDFEISDRLPPFVIAEIGVNHEGSLETARELIRKAREGGAHAAKFQTYKAGKLASRHSPSYWDLDKEPTRSQYQLFKKYDAFSEKEYGALAEFCDEVGIQFVSTAFDEDAVDFLDPLMTFFKVASADLTNVPLLRKVASKGKPVVLSTGASTLSEIELALDTLSRAGCDDVALLHCILNYPTEDANAHLGAVRGLKHAYPNRVIGYSDHTLPDSEMTVLGAAYLIGARIIEKHFTHDKSLPGNDHYHAMDKDDLCCFTERIKRLRTIVGADDLKRPLESEMPARMNARRSIVLARPLQAGSVLSEEDLTHKRPGTGIAPLHWDEVLCRRVRRELEEDHVLQWEDLTSPEEA